MPHGMCYLWRTEILWLQVTSNALIAGAYFSIPIALYVFARRRTDLEFRAIFYLFTAFITLCGLTHLLGIVTIWTPVYGLDGMLKLATGGVSAVTAYVLWGLIPKALAIPGPAELQAVNRELRQENIGRRAAEAKLRDTLAGLEEQVRIRTLDLERANESLRSEAAARETMQAELREAKERAEDASSAKSSFLAVMGHEIRTPLNAILGIAQLLSMTKASGEKVAEGLKIIEDSGKTLRTLLDDLLDYSKIEAGRLEIVPRDMELRGLVEQASGLWEAQAEAKGLMLAVQTRFVPQTRIVADQDRLAQVINNLLSNAIKYSSAGSVTLSIGLSATGRSTGLLEVSVTDMGVGIAPELRARLFRPFDQLGEDRSRRYGGTGLGLAISQRLVGLMGGEIRVETEPGTGSRFWFEIPVSLAATGETKSDQDVPAPLPKRRILSVDDNAHNNLIMTHYLIALEQDAEIVSSGAEAIERLSVEPFDIVFLDLRMPDVDGFDVMAAIRAGGTANGSTPTYALTANSQAELSKDLRELGFAGYIRKPVDLAMLRAIVERPVPLW